MDADVSLSLTDSERKIINEFAHLLEKSKQLFNGLRDLPQYGHKQWQAYFGRTFDVYTKLWKFQQANRQVLDVKYGLKRWQIGEIASKIGQLYYHYYLRTSEANYLNESFSFYSAIRMRAYYSKASKEDRTDLMVKKLRYYARFIVVCLLLKKMKLVRDLVRELAKQIDDYTSTYEPDDHQEWTLVLGEIRAFIEADSPVEVIDLDGPPLVISHRLTPHTTPPLSQGIPIYLSLQEIIIVGNCYEQIKFSELTIDMFRMLQTLEKEPQEDLTSNALYDQSPAPGRSPFDQIEKGPKNRENPHKYLLYKPTFTQLNTFLASGMKELPANSAMLLYLSADGSSASHKQSEDIAYDQGGVCTNNRRDDGGHIKTPNKRSPLIKDSNCLHPGDLYAYQRKPLFLVVDSDNSMAFRNFPNLFGQPLVCLLSPEFLPTPIQDQHHRGNLFTLFLYSPLEGVCVTSNIADLSAGNWEACQRTVHKFMGEASRLFTRARDLDLVYMQFFGDDFLRLLLLRFVFCYCVLRAHRGFKGQSYYPVSFPPMPVDEVLHHPVLHKIILELVTQLDVRGLFLEVMEVNE